MSGAIEQALEHDPNLLNGQPAEAGIGIETERGAALFSYVEEYRADPSIAADRNAVIGRGVMRAGSGRSVEKALVITPANEAFFQASDEPGVYELAYQHSGMVADMVLASDHVDQARPLVEGASKGRRPMAFFDVDGEFYDQALLKDVVKIIKKSGVEICKHTAIFEWAGEDGQLQEKTIAIDDIYCLSGALVMGTVGEHPSIPLERQKRELKRKGSEEAHATA